MNRHNAALYAIDPGACNPSGIANSLAKYMSEMIEEGASTDDLKSDPALRLMTGQLAFLMKVPVVSVEEYDDMVRKCSSKADSLDQVVEES